MTVLLQSTAAGHWAWVAVRLRPGNAREEPAERAWLAGQWELRQGARWELRCTGGSAVLLGRVHGRSRDAVLAAAEDLRTRFTRLPGHAEPVLDPDEIRAELVPPRPHPDGAFELRKPLTWAWCRRPERRRVCFAWSALTGSGSWGPVWTELARRSPPVTVAVHLEPHHPAPGFGEHLRRLAGEYAELAGKRRNNPMWTVRDDGDPFAASAAPGYTDAVRRYATKAYRLRVSVFSEAPVPAEFPELVADAIGGAAVCRVAPAELDAAWRNLAALNRDWLDETYRQGAPAGALDDVERVLCDLVDLDEAISAFRLPHDLSTANAEEPTVTESRKSVFVSYVREDSEEVDRIVAALRAAGYRVWLDRTDLLPGMRWKTRIKDAIAGGGHFLACFSSRTRKPQSYMNEELIMAVERLRLMPRSRSWFVPVRLDDCELPDYAIGPGETLADLQCADFGADWDKALAQVIAVLGPP